VKKVLSLVVALGVVALFSGVTLAGADCSYHKTQAAVTTPADTSKDVATAPVSNDKTDVTQVKTAEAAPPAAQTAPAPKK
jgi:hypothetical protein